jgi:hypothetical protein
MSFRKLKKSFPAQEIEWPEHNEYFLLKGDKRTKIRNYKKSEQIFILI